MSSDKLIRKRFDKPYHLLSKAMDQPLHCLSEIFKTCHLDDFRDDLALWQQLAMVNDQSAYDVANKREDLMDFCNQLHHLIVAFYVLHKQRNNKQETKWKTRLSKQARKLIKSRNQLVLLGKAEKENPRLVIDRFCKSFSYHYAKLELLDWLEAIITYRGNKNTYKENIVLLYQCLGFLISLAYNISMGQQQLDRLKKTIEWLHRHPR